MSIVAAAVLWFVICIAAMAAVVWLAAYLSEGKPDTAPAPAASAYEEAVKAREFRVAMEQYARKEVEIQARIDRARNRLEEYDPKAASTAPQPVDRWADWREWLDDVASRWHVLSPSIAIHIAEHNQDAPVNVPSIDTMRKLLGETLTRRGWRKLAVGCAWRSVWVAPGISDDRAETFSAALWQRFRGNKAA